MCITYTYQFEVVNKNREYVRSQLEKFDLSVLVKNVFTVERQVSEANRRLGHARKEEIDRLDALAKETDEVDYGPNEDDASDGSGTVSYTHLTLPTNREV